MSSLALSYIKEGGLHKPRRSYSCSLETRPLAALHLFRNHNFFFPVYPPQNLLKTQQSNGKNIQPAASNEYSPIIKSIISEPTRSKCYIRRTTKETFESEHRQEKPSPDLFSFKETKEKCVPARKFCSAFSTSFPSVHREISRRHSYPLPERQKEREEIIKTGLNRSYPCRGGPKIVFVDGLKDKIDSLAQLPAEPKQEKMQNNNQQNARSSPSTVIKDYNLKTILQNESPQIVGVIEKFLNSNIQQKDSNCADQTEKQAVKVLGLKHIETPLKHYWDKVIRVGDEAKNAIIRVESLLNMELNDKNPKNNINYQPFKSSAASQPQHFPSKYSSSRNVSQEIFSGTSLTNTRKQENMPTISCSNANTSSTHWPNSSLHSISPTSDYDSSSGSSQIDLLALVHQKVQQKTKLDWSDLFLLKNAHCRFVLPRERLLRSLKDNAYEESAYKYIELEIVKNYKHYQLVLEQCLVVDKLYTKLAFNIMRAEVYWYVARITSDISLRNHSYNVALRRYAELLTMAKDHLLPDNKSLLTILEKVSAVLVECSVHGALASSGCMDRQESTTFVQNCRQAVVEAEKKLATKIDVKKERKLIKIKNNLMRLSPMTMSQKIY